MAVATALILDEECRSFYQDALQRLENAGVRYLVGGAYAFAVYTGIERHTKDFDLFIRRTDFERAKAALGEGGYETELTFSHWLGKAKKGEDFVDLIFSAGNGVAEVDDLWFEHATPAVVFGREVNLIPAEEMIWSKGLIMERERFDGADVIHVLRAVGDRLDWKRLIGRYGPYWRALYAHVIMFGFVYPSHRSKIPRWVMGELAKRVAQETERGDLPEPVCFGTLLSRQQYLSDINDWGYIDARLAPNGRMSSDEIQEWTAGIEVDGT